MSRYRGPRLRITRRLGDLPGLTRKSAKRSYPPGQHGQARRKRSEYAIRLEEKQKLRFNYGISERQLVRYVKKARAQEGSTGTNLLKLLECRLDNVVYVVHAEIGRFDHGRLTDLVGQQHLPAVARRCQSGGQVIDRPEIVRTPLVCFADMGGDMHVQRWAGPCQCPVGKLQRGRSVDGI